MSSNILTKFRVHVVPVGFEFHRVCRPCTKMHAEKVYLLTQEKGDEARNFVNASIKYFQDAGYKYQKDLFVYLTNIHDLATNLRLLAHIFRYEQTLGNSLFYNVSTGSKIMSIAGMFACMLFGGTPYYCVPKHYATGREEDNEIGQITIGIKKILPVQKFAVEAPVKDLIQFLFQARAIMKGNKKTDISKQDCVMIMRKLEKEVGDKPSTGDYNKLQNRYLKKLENRGYISNEAKPRKGISLTEDGEAALSVFSVYYKLENLEPIEYEIDPKTDFTNTEN